VRHALRLFFTFKGVHWWLVVSCLFISSFLEGIGLLSVVPLFSVVLDNNDEQPSELTRIAQQVFDTLGLQLEFGPLLAWIMAFLVLNSVFALFANRMVAFAITDVVTDLRTRVIREFFQVGWKFIIQHPIGRVSAIIGTEADRVGRAYEIAATFVTQVIQVGVYLVIAFIVSWPAALLAIVVGAMIAGVLQFLVQITRKAGRRQTKRMRELMIYLSDTLINLKPLKAMGKERSFVSLLEAKVLSVKRELRRSITAGATMKSGQEILVTISMGIGFFIAMTYWDIQIIEIVVVGAVLSRSLNGFNKMQSMVRKAAGVEAPYVAIQKLFKETEKAREQNTGTRNVTFEQDIRFENVSFGYDEKLILQSVSMTVPAKSITALIGPSGAGKTTCADLVIGLYPVRDGRVLIDDVEIDEIDMALWRRQIGYVPQELVLFHDTILANISLGDEQIGEPEAREALETAGAWDFIEKLPNGLNTVVGEKGSKLSGGQRQRIALARALAAKPRLLIMDEVTSALDPETEREICENIRSSLAGEVTVLAITHRPAFLEIADHVYAVDGGQIRRMERGPMLAEAGGPSHRAAHGMPDT